MKNLPLAFLMFFCSQAYAGTWECIDSTDGHKYKVSQDVASDVCKKVSDSDHRLTGTAGDIVSYSELRANDIAMQYARSDSFCVKVGGLTASAARIRALGGIEKDLLTKNKLHPNGDPKSAAARRSDEINKIILDNMIAFVYTVKLSPESARLVGYKKCLAGDFD